MEAIARESKSKSIAIAFDSNSMPKQLFSIQGRIKRIRARGGLALPPLPQTKVPVHPAYAHTEHLAVNRRTEDAPVECALLVELDARVAQLPQQHVVDREVRLRIGGSGLEGVGSRLVAVGSWDSGKNPTFLDKTMQNKNDEC